jgi:hypothetical protein
MADSYRQLAEQVRAGLWGDEYAPQGEAALDALVAALELGQHELNAANERFDREAQLRSHFESENVRLVAALESMTKERDALNDLLDKTQDELQRLQEGGDRWTDPRLTEEQKNSLRGHGLLDDGVPYRPFTEGDDRPVHQDLSHLRGKGSFWHEETVAYRAAKAELQRLQEGGDRSV